MLPFLKYLLKSHFYLATNPLTLFEVYIIYLLGSLKLLQDVVWNQYIFNKNPFKKFSI